MKKLAIWLLILFVLVGCGAKQFTEPQKTDGLTAETMVVVGEPLAEDSKVLSLDEFFEVSR